MCVCVCFLFSLCLFCFDLFVGCFTCLTDVFIFKSIQHVFLSLSVPSFNPTTLLILLHDFFLSLSLKYTHTHTHTHTDIHALSLLLSLHPYPPSLHVPVLGIYMNCLSQKLQTRQTLLNSGESQFETQQTGHRDEGWTDGRTDGRTPRYRV